MYVTKEQLNIKCFSIDISGNSRWLARPAPSTCCSSETLSFTVASGTFEMMVLIFSREAFQSHLHRKRTTSAHFRRQTLTCCLAQRPWQLCFNKNLTREAGLCVRVEQQQQQCEDVTFHTHFTGNALTANALLDDFILTLTYEQ